MAKAMDRAVGAIVFLIPAYTVLMLAVEPLPPKYATGAALLVPLIGFAVVGWVFVPDRKRQ